MLKINNQLSIPLREFAFTFARSGGPGGQNVNKVNTKVYLKWNLDRSSLPDEVLARFRSRYARRINQAGELVLSSQRFRDQGRNVADCLEKLRELVAAIALPPKRRRATKPTRAARERRIEAKKRQSARKKLRQKPNWD